jgi:uncharacterized membrane protein HdeD (DUF308 family)
MAIPIRRNTTDSLSGRIDSVPDAYEGSGTLISNWKMMTARGIFSIAFGLLALAWPVATLYSIALLFGAYALVDGVFSMSLAFRRARNHSAWGLAILEGVIGVAAGVVTLFYPALTVIVLLYTIAVWAIATGFLEIYAGIRVRADSKSGFLLVVMGVLSLALGSLVVYRPIAGGVAVVAMISAYALIFGVAATVLGLRLRIALRNRTERIDRIAA